MLMAGLIVIAVALLATMFVTRNAMLGFPSVIFWALVGAQAYVQSTATWDVYFIFAFACLLGMTTFCAFGAYGLREKRDTIGDEEMEKGDRGLVDEQGDSGTPDSDEESARPRTKTGTRRSKSRRRREFDF